MPIYEYRCKNCGNKIELLQFYNENKELYPSEYNIVCNCGNWDPEKIISMSSFCLNGCTWAKDGYKNKKK